MTHLSVQAREYGKVEGAVLVVPVVQLVRAAYSLCDEPFL